MDFKKLKNFRPDKTQLVLLILAGVLLLVIAWPAKSGTSTSAGPTVETEGQSGGTADSVEVYVKSMEAKVTKLLEAVEGAGKVQVMLTVKTSKELVVEKDVSESEERIEETDASGGSRKNENKSYNETTIYGSQTQNGSGPYVTKEIQPEIQGVVVAAQGGDVPEVVEEITRAVEVLFDIPIHKIKVVKMNTK